MNNSPISNPFDDDEAYTRNIRLGLLGIALLMCCGFSIFGYTQYQTNLVSLYETYFPSPTATATKTKIPTPSNTPTSTNTLTPTITHTPTLTYTPHALIPAPAGAAILEDSFDSNDQGWHDFYKNLPAEITDGKLILASNAAGSVEMAVCQKCTPYMGDFYYQAELLPSKSVLVAYGLSFCSPDYGSEYYIFEISLGTNSYYLAKLHMSTNTWEHLIFNEYSDAINDLPLSNILGVFVHQQEIDLYINGKLVDSVAVSEPLNCKRLGLFMDGGVFNLIADNVFAFEISETPFPTSTPTP